MPHTIFAPIYRKNDTRIIDQRTLRIMNAKRTPEARANSKPATST